MPPLEAIGHAAPGALSLAQTTRVWGSAARSRCLMDARIVSYARRSGSTWTDMRAPRTRAATFGLGLGVVASAGCGAARTEPVAGRAGSRAGATATTAATAARP